MHTAYEQHERRMRLTPGDLDGRLLFSLSVKLHTTHRPSVSADEPSRGSKGLRAHHLGSHSMWRGRERGKMGLGSWVLRSALEGETSSTCRSSLLSRSDDGSHAQIRVSFELTCFIRSTSLDLPKHRLIALAPFSIRAERGYLADGVIQPKPLREVRSGLYSGIEIIQSASL